MKTSKRLFNSVWFLAATLVWPATGMAQVPVDENGTPIGQADPEPVVATEDLPVLSAAELEDLIGPIALYPDDLLAIVLPASTYPLQIVQAARFLEDLERDSSLKPDDDWDDAVVALTNYPEVVEMMSDDLDWTWRLGEAVVAQQTDVIRAIESFRDRAYAAGNLKSDDFQNVTEDDGVISITPVEEEVIYVPYYEPERVVVYQPRPVYYYYPRAYPVYYYPYPAGYSFSLGYFWGVTTAFTIGWHSHHLHTWHHSYYGHPYYGRYYWDNWWYRRPDIHVYNNYYVHHGYKRHHDYHHRGDYWQPNTRRTIRGTDQRITRTRYYPSSTSQGGMASTATTRTTANQLARSNNVRSTATRSTDKRAPISFRERSGTSTASRSNTSSRPSMVNSTRDRSATLQTRRAPTDRTATTPSRPSTVKPSNSRTSTVRPSVDRPRTVKPSVNTSRTLIQPKASSVPKRSYTSPSTPKPSYSRPSTPKPSYSRPSTPKPSYSRSSTPKPSYSRPSTPKVSQSRSKPSSSKPASSRSSSSSRSVNDRRR